MKVGIIGAGISGVVTGAHLRKSGIDVTVFERSAAAGGVWFYDERSPLEPTYPATKPSEGDVVYYRDRSRTLSTDEIGQENDLVEDLRHAPPGPSTLWWLRLAIITLLVCLKYPVSQNGKPNGPAKCNTQRVTAIPEASEIKFVKPSLSAGHSPSRDRRMLITIIPQNVLLIGAGVSSADIARELGSEAKQIYQSSRGGAFDLPTSFLPQNATRIGELDRFESLSPPARDLADGPPPLPGRIFLKDGRVLEGIHRIVLCTGYHISLPFLRDYHDDETPIHKASDITLVTDGTQLHNLHKDIFYIPDPTLVFVGVPYFTATFTLFEFQAMTVAAVLSGKAFLPCRKEMERGYRERVERKGVGKMFHSLKDEEVDYVDELLSWVNTDGATVGAEPVEGHTQAWHEANIDRLEKMRQRLADLEKDPKQ